MHFTLACDIMMDLEGSVRPAMYLARDLIARGHDVSMMSPVMSHVVEDSLRAGGITPINLQAKLTAKNSGLSLLWFETWAREAFLGLNSKHIKVRSNVAVNFSHTIVVPSVYWYLQGPTSRALKDMRRELNATYRFVYEVLRPLIEFADGKLVKDMSQNSTFCVANSQFCASMYRKWGIQISDIIYPPIDCKLFQPKTSSPSSDYVLTYFGKETKFSIVKAIADLGVRIKAFGSKAPFIPRSLVNHPNVDFLGRISVNELVDAYTNALFTFFPFTHEPFGYIPVESMACGTPTLTYDSQGPSESIINEYSGWFAQDDTEIVNVATSIWKRGYKPQMRQNCVKEASKYDKSVYVKKWLQILEEPAAKETQAETVPLLSIGSLPFKTSS
jgi:glycosyltransferase involved in cell wall biosynthesis